MEKSKLENNQAQQLNNLAKEFLNEGKAREAFALIQKANFPSAAALTTLVGVWVADNQIGTEALRVFSEYIGRIESFSMLKQVLLFLQNRKRYFVDPAFTEAVERRMKDLDPTWDGSTDDNNAAQMEEKLRLLSLPIESINDPKICLDCASFSRSETVASYLDRYVKIGGDIQTENYLKVKLNAISRGFISYKNAQSAVLKLASVMGLEKFKGYVKRNSKKGNVAEGKGIARPFRSRLLANFVNLAATSLTSEDWTFIAEQSIDLNESNLQLICYERLKKMKRDASAQAVFEVLHRQRIKEDKFLVSEGETASSLINPIYADMAIRQPVNMDAVVAIGLWSKRMLEP